MESFAMTILDATYHEFNLVNGIYNQKHSTKQQKNEVNKLFNKFTKLFDGALGFYPHRKVNIELLADADAKNARHYSVPQMHLEALKNFSGYANSKYWNPRENLNGHIHHLLSLRKMDQFAGSATYSS